MKATPWKGAPSKAQPIDPHATIPHPGGGKPATHPAPENVPGAMPAPKPGAPMKPMPGDPAMPKKPPV